MPKCMWCKEYCRKMYRMGYDEIELVCQKCALADPVHTKCPTCLEPLRGKLYYIYDGNFGEPRVYHKQCFLKEIQADKDEIAEFKEDGLI